MKANFVSILVLLNVAYNLKCMVGNTSSGTEDFTSNSPFPEHNIDCMKTGDYLMSGTETSTECTGTDMVCYKVVIKSTPPGWAGVCRSRQAESILADLNNNQNSY
jgi:hypothetical protein